LILQGIANVTQFQRSEYLGSRSRTPHLYEVKTKMQVLFLRQVIRPVNTAVPIHKVIYYQLQQQAVIQAETKTINFK